MSVPSLTFACELPAVELVAFFAEPGIIAELRHLAATVSLGIIDLTPERASAVRQLNAAGVPVVAWQLLPKDEGYWYNLLNAEKAAARYAAFQRWTATEGLRWAAVAIDIEPDINQLGDFTGDTQAALRAVIRGRLSKRALRAAEDRYRALVAQMHADGYTVQSYVIPPIVDERRVGATLLRRLFRLGDIATDGETLMLYTSFMGNFGEGVLWSYSRAAQSIGLGSTGGGVEEGGLAAQQPLTWAALTHDLLVARQWQRPIFIFSLEGCVRQGYLARLREFDWEAPPPMARQAGRRVSRLRWLTRFILRTSRFPPLEALWLGLARVGITIALRPKRGSAIQKS